MKIKTKIFLYFIKTKLFWWFIGLLNGLLLGLDVVWARQIDLTKAGVSLWVFLSVGAAIILLQAIPAIIVLTTIIFQFKRD